MEQNRLVNIEENNEQGLLRYRILGLNVFVANTTLGDLDLLALQDKPILKFLSALTMPYDTICLLGSPAPDNWRNQEQREGNTVHVQDLLGKETNFFQMHLSYYGGTFRAEQNYGPSLLFRVRDQKLLAKLSRPFLGWDALALLMYVKEKNGLSAAQNALHGFSTEAALMEAVLQEARCMILTQADHQYLEVYTKSSNLLGDLDTARVESEAFIKGTEWYRAHRTTLVWDETQLCYVSRPPVQ